jgi:hypothetical protein
MAGGGETYSQCACEYKATLLGRIEPEDPPRNATPFRRIEPEDPPCNATLLGRIEPEDPRRNVVTNSGQPRMTQFFTRVERNTRRRLFDIEQGNRGRNENRATASAASGTSPSGSPVARTPVRRTKRKFAGQDAASPDQPHITQFFTASPRSFF